MHLKIGVGEILGLVDESGCEEITVALLVMRLIRHLGKMARGEIWFEGEDLISKIEAEMRKTRGRNLCNYSEPRDLYEPCLLM